jgi:hypothetical protein
MPTGKIAAVQDGKPWSGDASINPFNTWGTPDAVFDWAGWIYAVDADTGAWRWRAKTNYPIQSGMTPTAGGIVFFGDMGGNFYVLDAANGRKLWSQNLRGAIGGGVITYSVNGSRKGRRCKRSHRNSVANRNYNRQGSNTWIGVRRAIAPLLGPAYGGADYVDRILRGEKPGDLRPPSSSSTVRFASD